MEISVNERGSPLASTDEIMLIQETMRVLGLYDGQLDGIAGSATLRAVRAYKKQQNMPVDNKLTPDFIEHLRHQT